MVVLIFLRCVSVPSESELASKAADGFTSACSQAVEQPISHTQSSSCFASMSFDAMVVLIFLRCVSVPSEESELASKAADGFTSACSQAVEQPISHTQSSSCFASMSFD